MVLATTTRLRLRHFTIADAAFILRLLNEPTFIRHIADRGVRTEEDAVAYLERGPIASYAAHGHGLNWVGRADDGTPIGTCGLLQRDGLDCPDLGYALLPEHAGHGLAREAAAAVMHHAQAALGLQQIAALVNPDNVRSIRLLADLGFAFTGTMPLPGGTVIVERHDWVANRAQQP